MAEGGTIPSHRASAAIQLEAVTAGRRILQGMKRTDWKKPLGISLLPLFLGLLFFAASLTPSLIPRCWALQGILGGTVAVPRGMDIPIMRMTISGRGWR